MAVDVADMKNGGAVDVGTSNVVVFTAPSDSTRRYLFKQLDVANKAGVTVNYDLWITDNSTGESRYLADDIPIPAGAMDPILEGSQLTLEPNDSLNAVCNTAAGIDINLSYSVLEIS